MEVKVEEEEEEAMQKEGKLKEVEMEEEDTKGRGSKSGAERSRDIEGSRSRTVAEGKQHSFLVSFHTVCISLVCIGVLMHYPVQATLTKRERMEPLKLPISLLGIPQLERKGNYFLCT